MINKLFILLCLILLCIIYGYIKKKTQRYPYFFSVNKNDINKNYYLPEYRFLNKINKFDRKLIYNEVFNVHSNKDIKWSEWPEKELYTTASEWKIFPFFVFGKWIDKNCDKCPTITSFLKLIPNLKIAVLSRLNAKMKLTPHRGWGGHSNHVLRCHYPIIVPKHCYISVSNNGDPPLFNNDKIKYKYYPEDFVSNSNDLYEEIHFHKQYEWVIFDDSETHYAENLSDEPRVILLLDIERPSSVKAGTSEVGDTKELLEIVKYYKEDY
jgi:hypothetical protein